MKKQLAMMTALLTMIAALSGCGGMAGQDQTAPQSQENTPVSQATSQAEQENDLPALTQENILEYPETDPSEFGYTVDGDTVKIDSCSSDADVIVVPEKMGDRTIVGLEQMAMTNLPARAIVLPDTIESIDAGAFGSCYDLEYVHLGSGLKTIGELAFNDCTNLKQVVFPEGMEEIAGFLFGVCPELEKIVIPATVTEIPGGIANPSFCPKAVVVAPAGSVAADVAANINELPVVNP